MAILVVILLSSAKTQAREYTPWSNVTGGYIEEVDELKDAYCSVGYMVAKQRSRLLLPQNTHLFWLSGVSYERVDGVEYTDCSLQTDQGLFNLKDNIWTPAGSHTPLKLDGQSATIFPAPADGPVVWFNPTGYDWRSYISLSYDFFADGELSRTSTRYHTEGYSKNMPALSFRLNNTQPRLQYDNGVPVTIRHLVQPQFSANGRYMVAVMGGGGLVWVDLKTGDTQQIEKNKSTQPIFGALSNDGRYFMKSGGDRLFVYDTAACLRNSDMSDEGCIKKKFTLSHEINTRKNQAISNIRFGASADEIIVDVSDFSREQPNVIKRIYYQNHVYQGPERSDGYLAFGDSYSSGEGDGEGGEWYEDGTDEQGNRDT